MARRADYALGKAIRDGQDNGTVATRATAKSTKPGVVDKVTDFAKPSELYGSHQSDTGILALADNATPAEFETALTEAKAERNLSRANLVRKVQS